jgi:hypothetical protein
LRYIQVYAVFGCVDTTSLLEFASLNIIFLSLNGLRIENVSFVIVVECVFFLKKRRYGHFMDILLDFPEQCPYI